MPAYFSITVHNVRHIQKTENLEHQHTRHYMGIDGTLMGCPITICATIIVYQHMHAQHNNGKNNITLTITHATHNMPTLVWDSPTSPPIMRDAPPHQDMGGTILTRCNGSIDATTFIDACTHAALDTIANMLNDTLNHAADPVRQQRLMVWFSINHAIESIHGRSVYWSWPNKDNVFPDADTDCIIPALHAGHGMICPRTILDTHIMAWSGIGDNIYDMNEYHHYISNTPDHPARGANALTVLCHTARMLGMHIEHPQLHGYIDPNYQGDGVHMPIKYSIQPNYITSHIPGAPCPAPNAHEPMAITHITPSPVPHTNNTICVNHTKHYTGWLHGMPVSIKDDTHSFNDHHEERYTVDLLHPQATPSWDIHTQFPIDSTMAYIVSTLADIEYTTIDTPGSPHTSRTDITQWYDIWPHCIGITHPERITLLKKVCAYIYALHHIPNYVLDTACNNGTTSHHPHWTIEQHNQDPITLWTDMHTTLLWAGLPTCVLDTHHRQWHTYTFKDLMTEAIEAYPTFSHHAIIALHREVLASGMPTIPHAMT